MKNEWRIFITYLFKNHYKIWLLKKYSFWNMVSWSRKKFNLFPSNSRINALRNFTCVTKFLMIDSQQVKSYKVTKPTNIQPSSSYNNLLFYAKFYVFTRRENSNTKWTINISIWKLRKIIIWLARRSFEAIFCNFDKKRLE